MNLKKKDDGVSNVVGEMLLLAIAVVLVSVFAMSFFGIMPGERAEVIEFDGGTSLVNSGHTNELGFQFQHIWGDFITASDVRVIVYDGNSTEPISSARCGVTTEEGQFVDNATKATLDLSDYVVVWFTKPATGNHTFTFVITGPRGILETKIMEVNVS